MQNVKFKSRWEDIEPTKTTVYVPDGEAKGEYEISNDAAERAQKAGVLEEKASGNAKQSATSGSKSDTDGGKG